MGTERRRRKSPLGLGPAQALLAIVVLGGGLALVPATGCSNQGEGERCNTLSDNNGAEDCQSGLVCTAVGNLGIKPFEGAGDGRCCPLARETAMTAVCKLSVGAIPSDAGGSDAATDGPEEGGDSGGDAGSSDDASDGGMSDAPVDTGAPSDAGGGG
jgi:hypothetical protein